MSNTHRAVIETSVPPSIYPIAAGPKDFCEKYLASYIENHPLGEFDTGLILAVEPIEARQAAAERSFIDADGDRYMVDQSESGHNTVLSYENGEGGGMSMFIFKTEDADRIIGLVETAKGWAKK